MFFGHADHARVRANLTWRALSMAPSSCLSYTRHHTYHEHHKLGRTASHTKYCRLRYSPTCQSLLDNVRAHLIHFTLRYFSWPAKSTKQSTLAACVHTSSHVSLRPVAGCDIGCDFESNPNISPPTLDVRPDSISCLCLAAALLAFFASQQRVPVLTERD